MKNFLKKTSIVVIFFMFMSVLGIPVKFIDSTVKVYAGPTSGNGTQSANSAADTVSANTIINIRCSAKTSNSVTLEWNKVTNAVTYEIYVGSKKVGTTNGETKYTINSLLPNRKFKFYIGAKDNDGKMIAKSNAFEEATEPETVPDPGGDSDNSGGVSKPETLIFIENQDFSKDIGGNLEIKGCFLSNDKTPVNAKVFIDNVDITGKLDYFFVGSYRDDIAKKYPDYSNALNSGFSFNLDTYTLANGNHTIKIIFHETSKEVKFNVSNIERKLMFDNWDSNRDQRGFISGTGYIISSYNPEEFNTAFYGCDGIYIDGVKQSGLFDNPLTVKIARNDVKQKYPDYKYADKCGFSFKVDSYKLSNGTHKIKFKFASIEKEITINVQNSVPQIVIEGIDSNKNLEGMVNATGYILSAYDPNEFNQGLFGNTYLSIDGVEQSDIFANPLTIGISRNDVKQKYPYYKYADKCGFSFKVDSYKLSNGTHKIKFKFASIEKEITINVQNSVPQIVIEGIDSNKNLEGMVNATGYILSAYDPNEFNQGLFGNTYLSIDGVEQSDIFANPLTIGISRNDVKQKYPNYKYADKCGFSFKIDVGKFADGKHKLKIKLCSVEKEIDININNKTRDIVMESTTKSSEGGGKLVVSGYVLSPYSPDQLKNTNDLMPDSNWVYIDGNQVSGFAVLGDPGYMITLGIERNDIKAKYPNYNYSGVSGFVIKISNSVLSELSSGQHTMKIVFKNISKEFTFNVGK